MTLLDRIEAPLEHATIAERLTDEFSSVPGAVALAVGQFTSGTRGVLVIDAPETDLFLDAEALALDGLVSVRRDFPESAIDLLCLTLADAARFDVPHESVIHRYR
jgi:hypothetical protein